jgi:hypothetical protein
MRGRLLTIATDDTLPEAHLAEAELKEVGIKAVLTDEETVGMLWYTSNAIGGIKLPLLDRDADRAEQVIHRLERPSEVSGRILDREVTRTVKTPRRVMAFLSILHPDPGLTTTGQLHRAKGIPAKTPLIHAGNGISQAGCPVART